MLKYFQLDFSIMAKEKSSKKYFLIAIPIILIVIAGLFFLHNSSQQSSQVVGNQQILNEIIRLEVLNEKSQLTESDYTNLLSMVQSDPNATDFAHDSLWFIQHNITSHSSHELGYLYNYIKSGNYSICIPHEMQHIADYMQYNDTGQVNDTLARIHAFYAQWKSDTYQLKTKYPDVYGNLDQMIQNIDSALSKLDAGNYNVTAEMNFIIQNDFCQ
jgi:hypothetical protein